VSGGRRETVPLPEGRTAPVCLGRLGRHAQRGQAVRLAGDRPGGPPAQALAWVEAVLRANGCGRVEEELAWWVAELTVIRS
jgi:hypothetical protein